MRLIGSQSDTSSVLLIATLLLALAGCSTSSGGLDWESDAFKQRMAQVRDNGLANESARVSVEVAVDDGSMQAMVELALKHNPEIKAGRLRVERMREKPAQASALYDPVFSLTAGELAQTAAGQVDYIVGLTQALPFPGTLDARKAVAEQAVLTASAELLDRMERVAADVRRVYWRRYAVAQAIEVTKQDKQVLQQVSQIIDAKAKVGDAEQADQLRVSLRLAALDQELDRLEQQMRSLDSMMNRLLNRSSDATLPWPTETEWKPQDIDRKEAIAQAERNNPAVQVQRRRVEGYRQQFNLAKAERKPDFRVGLQYAAVGSDGIAGSANGDDQFAVTGAISIPLNSDKYDAREREALRGIGETLADLDAAQGKAANLAEDALARMDAEVSILNRLKKQMLPDSRRTFELALTGYRAGKVSFIQMMDDWQRTLDLELAAHRAQARYEQARADLSAALGEVAADASEERDDE